MATSLIVINPTHYQAMHYLSRLTTKRQRPLKGCARTNLLRKCFVGNYMVMYRNAHPQVTNLSFAGKRGLLYLDLFNIETYIITHEYTINPELFKVWMCFFKEVPENLLELIKLKEFKYIKLAPRVGDHGVDSNRIIFPLKLSCVENYLPSYILAKCVHRHLPIQPSQHCWRCVKCRPTCHDPVWRQLLISLGEELLYDLGMPELTWFSYLEYQDKVLQMMTYAAIQKNYKAILVSHMDEKNSIPTSDLNLKLLKEIFVNI